MGRTKSRGGGAPAAWLPRYPSGAVPVSRGPFRLSHPLRDVAVPDARGLVWQEGDDARAVEQCAGPRTAAVCEHAAGSVDVLHGERDEMWLRCCHGGVLKEFAVP